MSWRAHWPSTWARRWAKPSSYEAIPSTPAQMAAYAKAEREKWGQVIHAANIRLD
jgi:tripartite-type tricarboxylate transporter receptor subunit TctC